MGKYCLEVSSENDTQEFLQPLSYKKINQTKYNVSRDSNKVSFLYFREAYNSEGIWYRDKERALNTGKFELNHDLNTLPLIGRESTQWQDYGEKLYKGSPFTYAMVGRDCPWAKCTFCSWATLFPKFRKRTPESLLDEIGILIERYGIKEIFDDTGTFPSGKWLETFAQGMIDRGYNKKLYLSCNFRFDYLTPQRAALMKRAGQAYEAWLRIGLLRGVKPVLRHIKDFMKIRR